MNPTATALSRGFSLPARPALRTHPPQFFSTSCFPAVTASPSSAPSAKLATLHPSSCSPPAVAPKTSSKALPPVPDDYLPKPFDLNVLFARLTALLRRMHWQTALTDQPTQPTFTLAGRTIDLHSLEIRNDDKTIHLTLMEADLLRYLLDHPGKIIARKELLENVWHVKEDTDTRAIDNFVVRLRRYLEPDPAKPIHLLSVRGVGYRFIPDPDQPTPRDLTP